MIKKILFLFFYVLLITTTEEKCFAELEELPCNDVSSVENAIALKLAEIENYKLDAIITIDNHVAYSQIIGKTPDMLRISQRIKNGDDELTNLVVFDGRYQWIESKLSNRILNVSKIRLSEVVKEDRPFDTGYYVQGAGIFSGEDYLSTIRILLEIYDLSATCSTNKILLMGSLDEEKFESYAQSRKFAMFNEKHAFTEQYKKNFKYAHLAFDSNFILNEYALGTSKNDLKLNVDFQHIQLNQSGLENQFRYQIDKGIEPEDITDELKQVLSNN